MPEILYEKPGFSCLSASALKAQLLLCCGGSVVNSLVGLLLRFLLCGSSFFFHFSLSSSGSFFSSLLGSFWSSLHSSLCSIHGLLCGVNLLVGSSSNTSSSAVYRLQQAGRQILHVGQGLSNRGAGTDSLQGLCIFADELIDGLRVGFCSSLITLSDELSNLLGHLGTNSLNLFGVCILNLFLKQGHYFLCLFYGCYFSLRRLCGKAVKFCCVTIRFSSA